MTVTIRFEKLRFIGESHDQVRDAQVYRGELRSVPDAPVYRRQSRSGSRLRFTGESHDQV